MDLRTPITLAAALALGAGALALTPADVTVAVDATRDGDVVTFAGTLDTPDPGPAELPGFLVTEFADEDVAEATGVDLVGATIEEYADEDGEVAGLRFTWLLGSSLPPTGVPEGVRYNWSFTAGGETFQLQVKRSNLVSVTTPEAPVSHLEETAEADYWFQVRGACTANYPQEPSPVAGCFHLGFLDGAVDVEAGSVSMDVPYGFVDESERLEGTEFARGRSIDEAQSATMSITASLQAGVSNTASSAYLNGWGTYHAGTVVAAALGDADGPTTPYTALDTPGDGSVAGTLSGAGERVWFRVCRGYGQPPLSPAPCTEVSASVAP